MNHSHLKIFLSSTFVDLKDVREKILKFLSVLNSDIINMEVFGSDETHPKDYCLQRVEDCNFFIGIYAERYGAVDVETGLSITQMEYDTAYKKLNNGTLKGLLLYVLDESASWPINLIDRDAERAEKLLRFKNLITQRHTLSLFKDVNELPFNILRDTIRKMEIGQQTYFVGRKHDSIALKTNLERPIGMEFFNRELADLFFGREDEIEKLIIQLMTFRFSLLIGLSGIGKTSLINAGIVPKLTSIGWVVSVIRPLNDPIKNLKNSLWKQLMNSPLPNEFDFIDAIRVVVNTFKNKKILIIIDQFEDLLNCKSKKEIDNVISDFMQIYTLDEPNLNVLISYRGDVESDIGNIWQKISGAADGLPRFYLNTLSKISSQYILEKTLSNLGVNLEGKLLLEIVTDLSIESLSNGYNGIFPPFLQMIIVTIYEVSSNDKVFDKESYTRANGCKGIISGYLIHQLEYLAPQKDNAIKVLIALVSNYGTKTQKSLSEIKFESKIDENLLSDILSKLIDLRLIRSVESQYEITHDLLAKNILTTLVTEEELNIRKFKFLLSSKAAAYESTDSGLTLSEHLYLYKYRSRIDCNKDELILFLDSKVKNKAPIKYWITPENLKEISEERIPIIYNFDYYQYPYSLVSYEKNSNSEHDNIEKEIIRLSRGNKGSKLNYFYNYCDEHYTKHLTVTECRNLLKSKKNWQQLAGIVGIATKGGKQDLVYLEVFIRKSLGNNKNLLLAFKSWVILTEKLLSSRSIKLIINNYTGPCATFITSEIGASFKKQLEISQLFSLLLSPKRFLPGYCKFIMSIIEKISSEKDANEIRRHIYNHLVDNEIDALDSTLYLSFALKYGADYDYFISIIQKSTRSLEIQYVLNIHEEIATLANKAHYNAIKSTLALEAKFMASKDEDFISFKHGVKNAFNKYIYLWVSMCAFCRMLEPSDKKLLFPFLNHYLWTLKNVASRTILNLSIESDIDYILSLAISKPNEDIVKLLSALDEKFYSYKSTVRVPMKILDEYGGSSDIAIYRQNFRTVPIDIKKTEVVQMHPLEDDDLPF